MDFDPGETEPLDFPASRVDRAQLDALAAQMQGDPKKLGKEKKPDIHLVSLVFPG